MSMKNVIDKLIDIFAIVMFSVSLFSLATEWSVYIKAILVASCVLLWGVRGYKDGIESIENIYCFRIDKSVLDDAESINKAKEFIKKAYKDAKISSLNKENRDEEQRGEHDG